jgi:hypothetical protein
MDFDATKLDLETAPNGGDVRGSNLGLITLCEEGPDVADRRGREVVAVPSSSLPRLWPAAR